MRKHTHVRITKRDGHILEYVYDLTVTSTTQIAMLLFTKPGQSIPPSLSRCQDRLKKLTDGGFLERVEQLGYFSQGKLSYVYRVTSKGASFVAELRGISSLPVPLKPRQLFLPHLLRINDIRVAVMRGAQELGFPDPLWIDERSLRSQFAPSGGSKKDTLFVPDGHVTLTIPGASGTKATHTLFIEADLGTEQLTQTARNQGTSWEKKVRDYITYVSSGAYTNDFNSPRLRVVTVAPSLTRLKALKEATERAGGRSLFWFCTFEKIKVPGDIFTGRIFMVAGVDGKIHRLLDPDPSDVYYEVKP